MDSIVLFPNTMVAIFSISAQVSLIPQYDYSSYTFCDYGSPQAIGVQCPYLTSPAFISFAVIWISYFTALFIYQISYSWDYMTNDVRFYIICDLLHNEQVLLLFVYSGIVLTITSALVGIYFVCHNGTESSLGSIFVFTAVNIYNYITMYGSKLMALRSISRQQFEEKFCKPVYFVLPSYLQTVTKGYGVLVGHNDVLDYIYHVQIHAFQQASAIVVNAAASERGQNSHAKDLPRIEENIIRKVTSNVQQWKEVVRFLVPAELKSL
jgi:hypothetical protein